MANLRNRIQGVRDAAPKAQKQEQGKRHKVRLYSLTAPDEEKINPKVWYVPGVAPGAGTSRARASPNIEEEKVHVSSDVSPPQQVKQGGERGGGSHWESQRG